MEQSDKDKRSDDAAKYLASAIDAEVLEAFNLVGSIPFEQLPLHVNHESDAVRALVKALLGGLGNLGNLPHP